MRGRAKGVRAGWLGLILALLVAPSASHAVDAPVLDAATSPTGSNPYPVTGTAPPGATVTVFVEGESVGTVSAHASTGAFSFGAPLYDGVNDVVATATVGSETSDPSNALAIDYVNAVPRTQSGILGADTVWTPGNPPTPYSITADLTVAAGKQLVLQPGTTLKFSTGKKLVVNGKLWVRGAATSEVVFTSAAVTPARGNWAGIVVNATSVGTTIQHAKVEYVTKALEVIGLTAVSLEDSLLREFNQNGVVASAGATLSIVGCSIDNSAGSKQGTGVSLDTTIATLEANLVKKTATGISITRSSPSVTGNTVQDSTYGIYVLQQSSPSITGGNVFTANTYGVYVQGTGNPAYNPNPVVSGNEIYGNSNSDFSAASFGAAAASLTVSAEGNWWGSTDPVAIAGKIRDATDATAAPVVDFTPFLGSAGGAPVSGTYLNGPLAGGTTLTNAAPYQVVGSLLVPAGTTTTIGAGATLRFVPGASIRVEGTLLIEGSSGSAALLTSLAATPTRSDWGGIVVAATSSGATIEHVTIEYAGVGVDAYATLVLRDSTIREFQSNGVFVRPGVVATIESTTIDNSAGAKAGTGIYLDTAGAGTTIDGGLIKKANIGIYMAKSSPTITGNTIQECGTGISVLQESSPSITAGNVLTANATGLNVQGTGNPAFNPTPLVTGNQIHGNTSYDMVATSFGTASTSTTLDVQGNWWGSTDPVAISTKIRDHTDLTSSPSIGFAPFLDAPGGAPVAGQYLAGALPGGTILSGATPYQVVSTIRVPAGATLTIAAGTTLRFVPNSFLQVDGTLLVQGTSGSEALLSSLEASPARGDWGGIALNAGSAATTIEHATIEYAVEAIDAATSFTLRDSTLREFQSYGVYARPGLVATVETSTIDNSAGNKAGTGIYLDTVGPGTSIEGNLIKKANSGIQIYRSSPSITANTTRDGTYGIQVMQESSPTITSGNLVTANTHGVYVQGTGNPVYNPNPVTNGNQIYGNTTNNFYAASFGNGAGAIVLNAEANYWGSTDPAVIAGTIRDYTESSTSPVVDFTPFLDENGLPVGGGSYLSGTLGGNTTLTAGTYDVVGTVTVASGATLTIEAGSVLRFAPATQLAVQGSLSIAGSSASPVQLRSAAASPARGNWKGVVIQAGSSGNTIEYATIEHCVVGVDGYASFTLRNSIVREFTQQGVFVRPGAVPTIESNTIDQSAGQAQGTGVHLDTAGAGGTIAGNLVKKTSTGIYLFKSSPSITGNTIRDGTIGIDVRQESAPSISGGNLVTANSNGIRVQGVNSAATNPNPVINGNAIHGNTNFDLDTQNFGSTAALVTLDAQGNWWGTTGIVAIADQIRDYKTLSNSPVVDFAPFLDGPGGSPVAGDFVDRPFLASDALVSGKDYIVTSNVTVAAGATLTIPADVVLRFVPDAGLDARGTLSVAGTAADPVLFTSVAAPPARGDWDGVLVEPTSTGTTFSHAIVEYAVRGVEVRGASVAISDCAFRQFPTAGIHMSLGAGGTISDTLVDNSQIASKTGTGIYLSDSSPTISGTTVQGASDGIGLYGSASPVITGGTTITGNTRGLMIVGAGQGGGPQPSPVMHGSSLFGNTTANVALNSYHNPSGTASFDFSENWWGTTTAGSIAGTISQTPPAGSALAQVDFSDFLDGPNGAPIVAPRFLNILTNVSRSVDRIRPTDAETVEIDFTLAAPATVTVSFCLETDTACATPVRSIGQVFGTPGLKSVVWNGQSDTADYVADEAYSYRIVATDGVADGVNEGIFDPSRPTMTPPIGQLVTMTQQYNAHRNQGVLVTFNLALQQRLTLRVGSTPVGPSRPYLAGYHEVLWNGRDAAGNLVSGSSYLNFGVQTPLKGNIVLVEGTQPRIFGIGATPLVEVKSNPYLVVHSYEQIAQIAYRIDQDCYVTVKLLPPGVNDPASPAAILMQPATLLPAQSGGQPADHLATWTGSAPASPREALFADEGTYTFAIEATSASTGLSALYRGALQLRR